MRGTELLVRPNLFPSQTPHHDRRQLTHCAQTQLQHVSHHTPLFLFFLALFCQQLFPLSHTHTHSLQPFPFVRLLCFDSSPSSEHNQYLLRSRQFIHKNMHKPMSRLLLLLAAMSVILMASRAEQAMPVHKEGHCVMRQTCGSKGMFGKQLPCPDNGPAIEVCVCVCVCLCENESPYFPRSRKRVVWIHVISRLLVISHKYLLT